MLKHVKTIGLKEKSQPILTHVISAPIKNSNLGPVKLPDLGLYRESKIVQIPGDLQANNSPESPTLEKFVITKANSRSLRRYNSEQLFKTVNNTSFTFAEDNDDLKQKKFAIGQEILQNMGYKEIYRIENELSVYKTTKKN